MKRPYPCRRHPLAPALILAILPLLLGVTGCQPVLTALGEGPAPQPSATPTWPPPSTATPTLVPPTIPAHPTITATNTPTPTLRPAPTPTLIVTPVPTAGYYGDPAIGFSFLYPSTWKVEEAKPSQTTVRADELGIWIMGQSGLMDQDQTANEYVTELYKAIGATETAQISAERSMTLDDGRSASVREFAATGKLPKARAIFTTRGRRVFTLLIFAPEKTFNDYPRLLEAIAASLRAEEPRPYGIARQHALFMPGGQPDTLDPAKTLGGAGYAIGAIFSGLVMLDEKLQVVPDLAERWEVGGDGTLYTFYLRRNARFHDGKPVTARDVKASWERAAEPATGSNTAATYLGDIVGVKAKLQGKAGDISGVEVVDDYTLRVTIDAPKAYFLAKLTYPTSFVVDKENVKDKDWEHHPNGTGPFRLLTWKDDHLLILERNDDFYGEPAKLEHIVFTMYADVPMWMYENDEIDLAGVGSDSIERVTDPDNPLHADLQTTSTLCTSRLTFDVTKPPFDDRLVRQAFAYAVDRQKLTQVVYKNMYQTAETILPPGLPGYSQDIHAPGFDPAQAKELLAASKYKSASALPKITYTTSGTGGELAPLHAALVDMWRTYLGVEVTVEQLEPELYYEEIHKQHRYGQIIDMGWCADYPDPENFLDVLYHSGGQENLGKYSNPEVDKLLEQARVEADAQARMGLYHRIEQMIVDDTPDILLNHRQSYVLIKPYVTGYLSTPIDLALQWRVFSVERPTD